MILRGHVYHATSREPLAGISVSDGRNFSVTDQSGAYELERWEGAHVLFLNLLTEAHGDWFRYLEDTREEYDFFVLPVKTERDFCFFHTSDTEIDGREYTDCTAFMNRLVKEHRPAFFSHTGDLGRASVERHYLAMNRETVGCPVRYAIGNHDFVGERYGEETYERLYGPCWYSFDCGDIHFVTLSIGRGDKPSGYRISDQWYWLSEDLKRNRNGRRVIVFDHDRCPDELGFSLPVGEKKLRMREEGLLAWVFGHFHVHLLHEQDGVFNICTACPDCGGIDSSPAAVRKVSLSGNSLTSELLFDGWHQEPSDCTEWTAQLDGSVEFCTPVMQNGDLFVATNDDGYPKRCGIYRIRECDGAVVWYHPTHDGIKGDLATDEKRVYAQDTQGVLYCLDIEDGHLVWSQKSDLIKVAYTRSGVLLTGDLVLAGNAKHPYAYRKEDGTPVWDTEFPSGENTPARWGLDLARNRVLIGTHWKAMYSLSLEDGSIAWENTAVPVWFRSATPRVIGDRIYAPSLDSMIVLNAETGEIVREENLQMRMDVSGAAAEDDRYLYCPTAKHGVVALDKKTLAVKMHFATAPTLLLTSPYVTAGVQTVESAPVLDGDFLIFTASDGGLYVYNRETGALLCRTDLGAPSLVAPIVTEKAFYTADFDGKIRKLSRTPSKNGSDC